MTTYAQEQAFRDARNTREMLYQGDLAWVIANLTGADHIAALASIERARHRRLVKNAYDNSINSPDVWDWVASHPTPQESHTATDTTAFALLGGHYLITASATWGGGTVTFTDAAGNVYATFTANGTATVDLRWATTYKLAINTATAVSVTVKTAMYSPAAGV